MRYIYYIIYIFKLLVIFIGGLGQRLPPAPQIRLAAYAGLA